jgi:competence protein ComEA
MWKMTRKIALVVYLLCLGAALTSVANAETLKAYPQTSSLASVDTKVKKAGATTLNINTSDAETIADLMNGVGLKKAQAIVAYRTEKGEFSDFDDLLAVKGIGPVVIEKNKELIVFK